MKTQLIDCEPMEELAEKLQVPLPYAVGLVECLIHFCVQRAPTGGLAEFSRSFIARKIGWDGDAEALIGALVECGFLSCCCEAHGLVAMVWRENLFETHRKRIQGGKLRLAATCGGTIPDSSGNLPDDSGKIRPTETETELRPLPNGKPKPNGVARRSHANSGEVKSAIIDPGGSVSDSEDFVEGSDSVSDFGGDRTVNAQGSAILLADLERALRVPRQGAVDRGVADGKQRSADLTDLRRNIIPALLRSAIPPPQIKIIAYECATAAKPIAAFKERLKQLGVLDRTDRRSRLPV